RKLGLLLSADVTAESPRRGELAQLVTDHVLSDVHLEELVAVVNVERLSDELRNDRAPPCPGLDGTVCTTLRCALNLSVELLVNKRAFFQTTSHDASECLA